MTLEKLRKKYPKFIYRGFSYKILNKNLRVFFDFEIYPGIRFKPEIAIKNAFRIKDIDNLAFHAGLAEMPSYWKATCSSVIEIRAGKLGKEQTKWWEKLLLDGMGQFYYENKINWKKKGFLKIESSGPEYKVLDVKLKNRYLVPFAGGRDSIVTLEKLKNKKKDISLFTVNPIDKIQKAVKVSGIKKQVIIERKIDKKLLAMNKKGYLNGHTPFTSVLSFLSVLCAFLFDYKNIAFSNEKSADEGNVKYLGKEINHQWSKSSVFEKMFKNYSKKYLLKNVNYSSFLRKYTELEISKMFSKYPQYFSIFSSCNAGMKISSKGNLAAEKRWCGNCPKCLFVYMALYPYLSKKEMLKIFGKDLFENKRLLPIMLDMIKEGRVKPLECVGTKKESKKALTLCLKKTKERKPYLLTKADKML